MKLNIDYSELVFNQYIFALKEYTGLPSEEIEKKGQSEGEFKNLFTDNISNNPDKIKDIYQKSDVYMFANPYYYRYNLALRWEKFWKPILNNPGSVLDYGCGAGIIDKFLLEIGIIDITLCDLHSPTWDFVKFFFGNKVKYEEDVNQLTGKYDWIISNSVLEHIPDPLRVVRMWGEHLTDRGQIINSMATDIGGPHLQKSINQYNLVNALVDQINLQHGH